MNHNHRKLILAGIASLGALAAPALELPATIGDNMVLKQHADVRLRGKASPGCKVTVEPSWATRKYTATADADGNWTVAIPTPAATFSPQSIRFSDKDTTITAGNVLIGEVWLCSGQSNMEMPLRGFWTQPVEGAARAIAYSGENPGIRFLTVPKAGSYEPQDDFEGQWKVSSPENAPEFSALAYFFARSLGRILGCPVGIISCSYGGSKVEGWLPADILETYPSWNLAAERDSTSLQQWERINVMYNAMLKPVEGYTISGFLWNQGESNMGRHDEYPAHLADMVERWRKDWNQGELPFYMVELPGWNYSNPDGIDAALFRECQHLAASRIPSAGIVCTSDLVSPDEIDDIHASRKEEIGERLAWLAAARTYGVKGMPHTYPRYRSMVVKGNRAILRFDNADAGFTPNGELEGFEVAGSDGIFRPARATEDYATRRIVVEAPEGTGDIDEVRYCFKNFAIGKVADLMGMPLVPFRAKAPRPIVDVRDGEFVSGNKPYRYFGANFWYGAILASEGRGGDRARLARELDALQALGIDNLRVLAGGDGDRYLPSHIEPTLQTAPGIYNDTILAGLDYLLAELERRDMRAVIYLNNAWEWSGGYGSYLEWAGEGECPVPALTSYPEYMEFVAKFPRNEAAKRMAIDHARNIVSRTNSITGRPYSESPAIMAWQIANEPRAFSDANKDAFARWIDDTATSIKAADPNHLVTTGSEGAWGCEGDIDLWRRIHSSPNVDYATIHIWPYNWGWAHAETLAADLPAAKANTEAYINDHCAALASTGKPLVMDEFGFPRDGMALAPGSSTTARDSYYEFVLDLISDSGKIKGANFWGWAGEAIPVHESWQPGDPYTADPAQEDQGLNSVFGIDQSTIEIIMSHKKGQKNDVTNNF